MYARWFEFAAFCPVFRSHGHGNYKRGWREHLPWAHGPEVESIARQYSELRERLMPYTYTLAWQAHTAGTPLMRPLVLEYPQDPQVVNLTSEYLWGTDFLVSPVTRGAARHWPVYVPQGDWYDFWTDERHSGGRWIELDAPLDRMPLLVRAGAIVPMGPVQQYVGEAPTNASLEVLIYPAGESRFTLHEDDGATFGYERGEFAETEITCADSAASVRIAMGPAMGTYAGKPATRPVVFKVRLPAAPARVTLNGQVVRRPERQEQLGIAGPGWWHDPAGWLSVAATQADTSLDLAIWR